MYDLQYLHRPYLLYLLAAIGRILHIITVSLASMLSMFYASLTNFPSNTIIIFKFNAQDFL